ncbi:hypothetical protein [Evansella clarkii]|uniref:hypothetical protein n=1 Tax=Evansella clarkii TaxID=79879 RepID=UPI0014304430|nr:hypothetical protein [Evansella clarkii]
MRKWNEEAAPNMNLTSADLKASKFIPESKKRETEFSEELSDGGERNRNIDILTNPDK